MKLADYNFVPQAIEAELKAGFVSNDDNE